MRDSVLNRQDIIPYYALTFNDQTGKEKGHHKGGLNRDKQGGLFGLEVIVSDKSNKKAGRDDQEKDWK